MKNSDSDTESTFSDNYFMKQPDSFHIPKYALENKESLQTSQNKITGQPSEQLTSFGIKSVDQQLKSFR